ncbi:MAG: hypothetical protein WKF73_20850 [Nocardioidaceae bacterium]
MIDTAEIPTVAQKNTVDANGDETITSEERAAFASDECAVVASQQQLTVAGETVAWQVSGSELTYSPGAGGLQISRLDCRFTSDVDLSAPATVAFVDSYLSDRLGWREITATSEGVALDNPPVPAESRSDELRVYPQALLSSPWINVKWSCRLRPAPVSQLGTRRHSKMSAASLARSRN